MKRDKSQYAIAREPYKQLHPQAKMHHMHPTSRGGPDIEYNLFPWNERAHTAWHLLFSIMTVREVWPVLSDVHLLLTQTDEDLMVREWCLPYRYHGKKSEQKDIVSPQHTERLRAAWVTCFGGPDLRHAQRLVRYMMLHMVLGRHAGQSPSIYENRTLSSVLSGVSADADRAWAFRQCFGRLPQRATARSVKKIIRRVRTYVRSIPIH